MKDLKLEIKYLPLEEVMPYANNARLHGDEDIDAIMASIQEFGFNDPIGIWHGIIVEGHGRLIAAKRLGMETVPTVSLDHLTDEERKAYALAHNRTAELSGWNFIVRDEELANIANIDMSQFGFDTAAIENPSEDNSGGEGEGDARKTLAERFVIPPFSVIYGNKPSWLQRKRDWVKFGIRSEIGRGGACVSASRMDGETVTR